MGSRRASTADEALHHLGTPPSSSRLRPSPRFLRLPVGVARRRSGCYGCRQSSPPSTTARRWCTGGLLLQTSRTKQASGSAGHGRQVVAALGRARRRGVGGPQLAAVPVASAHRREDREADLPTAAQHEARAGISVGPHRGAGLDDLAGPAPARAEPPGPPHRAHGPPLRESGAGDLVQAESFFLTPSGS